MSTLTHDADTRHPDIAYLPFMSQIVGDARSIPLPANSADVIITSPPYWMKRDYGVEGQIGREATAAEFVQSLIDCMREWRRILPPWGSVFINIGDTYHKGSLASTPGRLEIAAQDDGWFLRNRIIWAKEAGMPDPAKDRLKSRHEYILHFTQRRSGYYYDQFGYADKYGNDSGPNDVWRIGLRRDVGRHLAPFPEELVDRIITLACPEQVSIVTGMPRERVVERTFELDISRPQARRALELAAQHNLTDAHLAAVQATGISDAGKALKVQTGTGRNAAHVKALAAEAKAVLGGYFREFTFAKRKATGWTMSDADGPFRPGIILDPFMGTGTTFRAAAAVGRSAIGVDLDPTHASDREIRDGGS